MIRPLRVGDRVTATGTVTGANASRYVVRFDNDGMDRIGLLPDALTLIVPAEPPVGSVVVKDGVAYHRRAFMGSWHDARGKARAWDDISDGDVIFTPGGDA